MDEIVVRIARALASAPRLRILSALAQSDELTPSALAESLGRDRNAISADLRTLVAAGLVLRRKSGPWCYYCFKSPYGRGTLSGDVTDWVRGLLREPKRSTNHPGLQKVRDGSPNAEEALHCALFEAATAFTDLRRLQLLRYLHEHKATTASTLVSALSMSEQALSRHLAKLARRGYVVTEAIDGRTFTHSLSPSMKSSLHARLLRIVRKSWETEPSRTS